MDNSTIIILIPTIAGLIKMFWNDRQSEKRAIREREWAMQDRQNTAAALAITVSRSNHEIKEALAANTELTASVGDKADAAYKEANNVNNKIESLGQHLRGESTRD